MLLSLVMIDESILIEITVLDIFLKAKRIYEKKKIEIEKKK